MLFVGEKKKDSNSFLIYHIFYTNEFSCCAHFSLLIFITYRYNVVVKAIAYYFLPLSIIGVLYALMARRLHLSAREMPGELAGPQRAQARARRHVARMVVTFVIGKLFALTCDSCKHIYTNINAHTHPYPFMHSQELLFDGFPFTSIHSSIHHLLSSLSRVHAMVSLKSNQ